MSKNLLAAAFFLLITALSSICAAQDAPEAPIPIQITTAKKVFIANGGADNTFQFASLDKPAGGPVRAYNEFYAAVKTWGHYEIASVPSDADLVFQLSVRALPTEIAAPQFTVTIIDPKTRITLWVFTEYAQPAGLQKNREKNYEVAMAALIKDLKALASAPANTPSK